MILRADSRLALPEVYQWAEQAEIFYLIGLARNSRLEEIAEPAMRKARALPSGMQPRAGPRNGRWW